MTDLEQSGSRILDALFVKLTVSLTIIFYFTKNESRVKVTFLPKRLIFCEKDGNISKIKSWY